MAEVGFFGGAHDSTAPSMAFSKEQQNKLGRTI